MTPPRTARDLPAVLGDMLGVIPQHERQLRASLTSLRTSATFAAPELQRELWGRGRMILMAHFGNTMPADGWGAKVLAMWRGDG